MFYFKVSKMFLSLFYLLLLQPYFVFLQNILIKQKYCFFVLYHNEVFKELNL